MTKLTTDQLVYILKFFERVIYNQINEYIEPFLSKVLDGFCKKYNRQHSLLNVLENFEEPLGKSYLVSTIFMDLRKMFNTLNRDLITAKLEVFFLHTQQSM